MKKKTFFEDEHFVDAIITLYSPYLMKRNNRKKRQRAIRKLLKYKDDKGQVDA